MVPGEWSLAFIGNAAEQTFGAERRSQSEAFSMRRLGGSRWRLPRARRTGLAMEFEWADGISLQSVITTIDKMMRRDPK
jgi:hypothetical protein